MSVQIEYEPNDVCVLRISGVLKQSEFRTEQNALARKIDSGSKPRLLVILENFEGWERGANWNDLDFLLSRSGNIAKIAIVAERRWETLALAFAGAGVRRAPVRFFLPILFLYNLVSQRLERTEYVELVCILMVASQDLPKSRTVPERGAGPRRNGNPDLGCNLRLQTRTSAQ
jgi:hypothetical protein